MKRFHLFRRNALLQQIFSDQCGTSFASHHAQIGVGFLYNLFQANHVVAMSAAHDHKISILVAVHRVQPLFEAVADHPLRSGPSGSVRKVRAVLQNCHVEAQQQSHTKQRHAHMARATDDQLFLIAQAVAEHRLPCQLLLATGTNFLRRFPLFGEKAVFRMLPEKPVFGEEGFCTGMRAIYDGQHALFLSILMFL